MMKAILYLFVFGILFQSNVAKSQDMDYIRENYPKTPMDKALCQSMIKSLEDKTSNLELAYLGALEMILAKHIKNPFSRLSTFKSGKKKLEEAIEQDSTHPEIRYLRLSIQTYAPKFLGYNKDIQTDKAFLEKHFDEVSNEFLKEQIKKLLEP